jgi:hypothetical protein
MSNIWLPRPRQAFFILCANLALNLAAFGAQRLEGGARNSPIVQDSTNWYTNVGLAYRF